MMDPARKILAEAIRRKRKEVEAWCCDHTSSARLPFYGSVDIRDAGFKIAPVDHNLFPAGFNNICPSDQEAAVPIIRNQVERRFPGAKKILILPEAHTQNAWYIENLWHLNQLFVKAGFETQIGWYSLEKLSAPIPLKSATGKEMIAHGIEIKDGTLSADGFIPDMVLLNNDFSAGHPEILDSVRQPIVPPHRLGWHTRSKGRHFHHYNQLAKEFANLIEIDPWLIQVETEMLKEVSFGEGSGMDEVASAVERVLGNTQKAYSSRHVDQEPFAFIKNDSGTYGIGIMRVSDPKELFSLNRREKNKMSIGKGKKDITRVVVQEGIPTSTILPGGLTAEPVIYLVGCDLIGGFLRTHSQKGAHDNLNAPGMVFMRLCVPEFYRLDPSGKIAEPGSMELVYGTLARISALASGKEMAEHSDLPPKI